MNKVHPDDLTYAKRLRSDIVGALPCPIGEGGKINPNVSRFFLADGKMLDVFDIGVVYYETRSGHWRPMSEITSFNGNRNIVLNTNWRQAHPRFINWLSGRQRILGSELLLPTPFGNIASDYQSLVRPEVSMGLTVTTVYPDASPETTTCDGGVVHDLNSTNNWATVQGAATGTGANDSQAVISANNGVGVGKRGNGNLYIERWSFGFDTSAIGGDTIDDATFSVYAVTAENAVASGRDFLYPTHSTPASNTSISTADYDQIGDSTATPTYLASGIDLGAISTAAYTDWVLNATGEGEVDGSGVSLFGLRTGDDISTAGAFGSGKRNRITAIGADNGSSKPKLAVTHTAGGGGGTPTYDANFFGAGI